jgi:hypothetical protein
MNTRSTAGGNSAIRIGGASGAWGDSPRGIAPLLASGVDVLMMDYLAEVTMSLLARARLKDPEAGYPPDFVAYLAPHLGEIARQGVRVVTNAGGVNPQACKRALEKVIAEAGLSLKVAVVEGDDLMTEIDALRAEGVREWKSGEPLPARMLTANAYLGALPIAAALSAGADIVVTGRCVDSALALGALMHAFGWRADQYDLLATGSLVGHLLECGPQVTGGVFTDWESVPGWDNIGYPIAECLPDGSVTITKPPGTGGLVTTRTVAEQTLYEVGDPAAYVLPDVVADFSGVELEQVGPDRVSVRGARGRPPTNQYKVSATWQSGWRAVAVSVIIGQDAARKAERSAQALVARARSSFSERGHADFDAVHVEVLGAEASYGAQSRARATREVVLRLVADHRDPKALNLFAREIGSSGLSFAQGTAALIGGRPKPTPVVRLFTFLIDKTRLPLPTVQIADGAPFEVPVPVDPKQAQREGHAAQGTADASDALGRSAEGHSLETTEVPLLRVAHARSGDKGDSANVAVFCRKPEYYEWLSAELTPERVATQMRDSITGAVERFRAPGLHAFNFLIEEALGGGGMASRRIDAQGKAYGQRVLEMTVTVPRAWLAE